MKFLYTLSIHFLRFGFIIASLFHKKARQFVVGRKNYFSILQTKFSNSFDSKLVWIHCASLGEFEQGRPIIESLKSKFPSVRILITFFSPSGYNIVKNYKLADYIFYLAWDTPAQAKKFIEITKPSLAIFIKYEFWYHYSFYLKEYGIPTLSASCILRPRQIFFKPYGDLFRALIHHFNFIFTQDQQTVDLLTSIGFTRCVVAGDTRFDRVVEIAESRQEILQAKKFKNEKKLFVIGSCRPEDMDVLIPFINTNRALKFIVAPHEISESFIQKMESSLHAKSAPFSQQKEDIETYDVLIIDNMGMLSKLYQYGEFAFVGGAFGKGLHNILEAACFGVPVFFGNKNYAKYKEATDLIATGGCFAINSSAELQAKYEWLSSPEKYSAAAKAAHHYVKENTGATKKIVAYCTSYLSA